MQSRRRIVMAIRLGEAGNKKKLWPDPGVETDCDYKHPREENGRDETLHKTLQIRECG